MFGMATLGNRAARNGGIGFTDYLATKYWPDKRERGSAQSVDPCMHDQKCIHPWSVWSHFSTCVFHDGNADSFKGASQEIVGTPADVVDTYKSALSLLSNTSLATGNAPEYRIWAERLLIRSCMLSEQFLKPDTDIDPETSLAPFRAWSSFWESTPQSDLAIGNGFLAGERRSVWRAYYSLLSQLLQHGYIYPGTSNEKHLGNDLTEHYDASARLRQSTELRQVEATYEGLLIKETAFPQADETNIEVLNWVDQAMANWSIMCSPEWQDEDLGPVGQKGVSGGVSEVSFRGLCH